MSERRVRLSPAVVVALGVLASLTARAGEPKPVRVIMEPPAAAPATQPADSKLGEYLRFVDKGSAGGRLETGDVAYRNDQGVTVHLVAAVHIGEKSYFEGLAQNFKLRDAVLYEMVKPRDAALPVPGMPDEQRSQSAVSQLQRLMKDTLNLEFQLDCIDYTQPNFIHADLDAETFQKMQAERGESFASLMLQQMLKAMSQPPPDENNAANANGAAEEDPTKQLEELIQMVTRPDGERRMKLMLARHMSDMEAGAMGLDGPNGSVIVTERNKAAVATLEKALKDGKKDIAIFYGAAHMPDLSKRVAAMGFKPIATEWRMAWDLSIRQDEPSMVEKTLMDLLHAMDEDNNR
jgi:hypothetical protein